MSGTALFPIEFTMCVLGRRALSVRSMISWPHGTMSVFGEPRKDVKEKRGALSVHLSMDRHVGQRRQAAREKEVVQ